MRKSLLAFILFFFHIYPSSAQNREKIEWDDLVFYERIILDYYSSESEKKHALNELDTRCRWKDPGTGLSCANLAILYLNANDLDRAYTAAAIAYKKEPKDNFYRNLFQNLAVRTNNLKDMRKRMGRDGNIILTYERAILRCKENRPTAALPDIRTLVNLGHLTRESLEKGIFAQCLNNSEEIVQLRNIAKPNKVSYSKLLMGEEDRNHGYYSIWDISYARKEKTEKLKDSDEPNQLITKHWMDFKSNLISGNSAKAKSSFDDYKNTLQSIKKSGGKSKDLAESLELATELILKQDPIFRDKADRMGIRW
ncbi:hypothetical protein [Leptospira sp. GIMC2001]|uniref:hypothetical protein n=1 Tax=Leptospira sp. GIMC2001 TaxID=1513297 RepID=UPI00234BD599|nr:hypothetical protein [Leptospira sp. GIMC2001]WCL50015.1 hypothetical protein O4O04_04130 [Leptospira sp. GIMC2001]